MPLWWAKPSAAGTPDSGTPITMSASTGAWAASCSPMWMRAWWTLRPYRRRVGAGEVHELEQAQGRLDLVRGEREERPRPVGVDHDHLARLELAHELGADDVERRALGGEHPALAGAAPGGPGRQAAQAQRAETVGVAHAGDAQLVHQDQGERALELADDLAHRLLERAVRQLGGDELGHQVAVAGDRALEHAGLLGQALGVDEVAVVAEGELVLADGPVHRLGVAPGRRPGGRVAAVADGEVAVEAGQRPVVEHGRRRGPGP